MIKKVLGYLLSSLGVIIFLSLYFLTVLFKDQDNIAIIIMGVGYVSITIFIIGIMLVRKKEETKK